MSWLVKSFVILAVMTCTIVCIAVFTPGWLLMKIDTGKAVDYYKEHSNDNQFTQGTYQSYPNDDTSGFNGLRKKKVVSEDKDVDSNIQYPKVEVDMSLMYFVVCVASVCLSSSIEGIENAAELQKSFSQSSSQQSSYTNMLFQNPSFSSGMDSWKQFRAEGIAAFAFCFTGMILAIIYACQHKNGRRLAGIVADVLIAIGGVIGAVLVWQFSTTYSQLDKVSELLTSVGMEVKTPYSMILMGFGSAFAFLTVVVLSIALKQQAVTSNTGHVFRQEGGVVVGAPILPLHGVHGVATKMQGYSELHEEHHNLPTTQPTIGH